MFFYRDITNLVLFFINSRTPKPTKRATLSKECPYCDLVCSNAPAVEAHIRKDHSKKRNLFCDICGFVSLVKDNLSYHMKKHINKKSSKSYSCLHCSKVFSSSGNRKYHIGKRHPDKGLNECFCGDDFKSADELKNHVLKVHNKSDSTDGAPEHKNKKQCPICRKYFNRLKTHMKSQ